MSKYFFAVGNGRIGRRREASIDRIAQRHEAQFIAVRMPEGNRYWFECENRGSPFDGQTAKAVVNDLKSAGLWLPVA